MEAVSFEPLMNWLAAHQMWLLLAVAVTAFLESFALVGIVVPGVAMLFALATLAAGSDIDIFPLISAGFLGAIMGDSASFYIGRHFKDRLYTSSPFNKYPQWINRGQAFFAKYGMLSVVIGRFVGPIRPVVPLVAGSLSMPAAKFLTINFISALVWAPAYLLPGYWIGQSVEGLAEEHLNLLKIAAVIALCIWLTTLVVVHCWRTHCQTKQITQNTPTRIQTWFFIAALAGFVALAFGINPPDLNPLNLWITEYVQQNRQVWLDPIFVFFTGFGTSRPIALFTVLLVGWLFFRGEKASAIAFTGVMAMSPIFIFGLKDLFGYARPDIVHILLSGSSFPSGHATIAALTLGFVGFLALEKAKPKHQTLTASLFASFIIVMCFSRIYLGVHWFTDILGGLCLATLLLIPTFFIRQKIQSSWRSETKAVTTKHLFQTTFVSLVLSYSIVVFPKYEQKLQAYKVKPLTETQASYSSTKR